MEKSEQKTNTQDHKKPRHWVDLQELSPKYWENNIEAEKKGQEFLTKPAETLAALEKLDTQGMGRRDFLTLMGASVALATASCARRPIHKIIPYVVKPEEITPGVPNYYASSFPSSNGGLGILVKTREGRPIKLEGNPDDPINQGALDALGQASVLDLYDTDRLKQPVKITRSQKGVFQKTSWTKADNDIAEKLNIVSRGRSSVRLMTGEISGSSSKKILREFLSSFRDADHIEYNPIGYDDFIEGQSQCYGNSVLPEYQFNKAKYVLSLGADFLGTWGSTIENTRNWTKTRKVRSGRSRSAKMSKLVCVEAHLSITGTNADERLIVSPGDELKIALSIAYVLTKKYSTPYSGNSGLSSVLKTYKPESVAGDIGDTVTAKQITHIAEALWENRGKSLVLAGGLQTQTEDGLSLQIATNFLNSLLGNEGKTINATRSPRVLYSQRTKLSKLISDMRSGKVDVLFLYQSNPIYSLPESSGFHEAIKKVPLVISMDERITESGWMSDYVLPSHHFLENWGDAQPRKGLHVIQQPVLRPLHQTRGIEDNFLIWTREATLRASGLLSRFAFSQKNTWYDYLKTDWKKTFYGRFGRGQYFHDFWVKTLQKGVIDARSGSVQSRSFRSGSLAKLPRLRAKNKNDIQLVLYSKSSMGDGRSANNGWLQELPDPVSTITWDNYVNVSPALARRLKIKLNDVVKISLGEKIFEIPVNIQPGMHPNSVSVAVGYGRTSVGRIGNKVGVNAFHLMDVRGGRIVASGMPVSIEKTGKRYELAITQNHHRTENRPIINDITLAEFQSDPSKENHVDPHLRMKTPTIWPKHKYDGDYRWGMAIDLNACTGCGACVVACQAENNIPIVGRDQVRLARELHWIRIDRYYSGPEENPDIVYQPMLCQHCENASCETVCPVLATVHNDEGLNEMVYNRCVGTRYCQNNCPYKVRRFNFFDHWKEYKGSQNLVWNPDVTVRTRGIMEKCSFCVQRIQEKKINAKKEGRLVRDGEIIPACQQTCAADAIVFGNTNDSESQVSKLQEEQHAFRVLEILNNKPQISYLSKVRNKERTQHDVHHS